MLNPYNAVLCQPETQSIFGEGGVLDSEAVSGNLERHCDMVVRAAREHQAKLVAFPQFSLSGYPAGLRTEHWISAAWTFPGPEIEQIGRAAMAAGAYVVVQTPERHPAFPGRYFLSAAVVDPAGQVAMVYRKNYSLSLRTCPIDVYDRFVETFGKEAFFPVLDTPLGRIGIAIGLEVQFPEVVRTLALKGAEILINPIAAGPSVDYLGRPAADGIRPVRALENTMYVAMTNRRTMPGAVTAEVYDYDGRLISKGAQGAEFAVATLDIQALRDARKRPALNYMAQLQPSVHEPLELFPLWPVHAFGAKAPEAIEEVHALEARIWKDLQQATA